MFSDKLAAAMAKLKAGAESAEIPVEDMEGISIADLERLLSGEKDNKETDMTPVPDGLAATSLEILAALTKPEAQMQAYVEAFSYVLLVHDEIHKAPVNHEKLHEHVVFFGSAVQDIAYMRFGAEKFMAAVNEYQESHLTRVKSTLVEEVFGNANPHFRNLRPKNRQN